MDTNRLRRLADQIRKTDETERSMRLASVRQQRMLPEEPEIEGFEFAVHYKPAAGVSGDFYDFIPVREGVWGIVVGDVSGHGVEAGIIMGMAKQTVSIFGRQMDRPLEVLCATNEELYRSLDGKTFVSLSYAVLDVAGRTLWFARAGQCRPLHLNARWKIPAPQIVESRGLALGVDSGKRFARVTEEIELKLEPGDVFFQYTDGLAEAANKEKEQFGEARLMDVLERYSRTTANELVEIVRESVDDFTRAREHEDDVTIVAVKVRETQAVTRTARFEIGQVSAAAEKRGIAPPRGFAPPAPKTAGPLAGVPAGQRGAGSLSSTEGARLKAGQLAPGSPSGTERARLPAGEPRQPEESEGPAPGPERKKRKPGKEEPEKPDEKLRKLKLPPRDFLDRG